MNRFDSPESTQDEPGQTDSTSSTNSTKKVEGRDPTTVRLKREYEAEVENKVASDYSHIVWAYGIIWALFAAYGLLLWRRASAQKADLDNLRAKRS
jgi:hypothetical protein